ncbi:MAG: hypothetical protein P0116_12300 [Candidatus Nitrosocosmicus sp.]|nr:hypothetical protein [Candidatus Nitrosocosmicus sp.]
MSSIRFPTSEELSEIISTFEYIDTSRLIKIQLTSRFKDKVIFQAFKVDAIEKSFKELERKVKAAIPNLSTAQYIAIESVIYEDLNNIEEMQNNNESQAAIDSKRTFQLRKYVFDGKVYESILVDNKPYFVTSDDSGNGYSLEERIEVAGNTFLPKDSLTTVNPLPYKFESEEELEKYFVKARKETFDSLYAKVQSEFKLYVNVPEHTRVVLSADIIYSYFQDKFGTTHYNIFIGENGSGKNSALLVLKHLGYRVFYVTAATPRIILLF